MSIAYHGTSDPSADGRTMVDGDSWTNTNTMTTLYWTNGAWA